VSASAGKMLALQFGPLWPRDLLSTDKPTAWNAGLRYGVLVDRKVGVGVGVDFLWNRTVDEKPVENGPPGLYEVTRQEKSFMFPVSAFVYVDPLSMYRVHPAATFAVGYNSMVYTFDDEQELTTGQVRDEDPDGYYFGFYAKLGIDALVNLSENSALFTGVEYQWANTRSAKTEENTYRRRNMGGVGVRLGLRLAM
jgi:hypothetical protein